MLLWLNAILLVKKRLGVNGLFIFQKQNIVPKEKQDVKMIIENSKEAFLTDQLVMYPNNVILRVN